MKQTRHLNRPVMEAAMLLTLEPAAFHPFSQGADIKADLKGGWCAGITADIGAVISAVVEEGHASSEAWIAAAFQRAKKRLETLAAQGEGLRHLPNVESLQTQLSRTRGAPNICGQIHTRGFSRRICRVAMSAADWVPVLGTPINYLLALGDRVFNKKWSVWETNHVGLLVRDGKQLLLFDPNYGLGCFTIGDDNPLTLAELTKAIATLAWKKGYSSYLISNTLAIAVWDHGPLGLEFPLAQEEQSRSLAEWGAQIEKKRTSARDHSAI